MNMIAKAVDSQAISPLVNFLSGILLKISTPFKKGDFIFSLLIPMCIMSPSQICM